MENSQSIQQQSDLKKTSQPGQIKKGNVLIHLLTNYPWLLVSGLLAVFIAVAGGALYSLLDVGHTDKQKPDADVEVLQSSANDHSEAYTPIPLWMVGVIGIGCASGCIIILRLLNRPKQKQKIQRHIKRHQTRLIENQGQKPEPRLHQKPSTFVTSVPKTKTKSFTTILPPEKISSLKKNQQSLAEMMDIRKENPLPSILRKH